MSASQINRYIIREILSPTLLCIVIFTMVMVLGRAFKLADLIINKGVSLPDIMVLLTTLLPTFFSITLPLAFLMGIMIGLGRLSADSETVALKSSGIGLARISIPVFALAFIFSLLTGAINIWAKPWGYRTFETRSFEIARKNVTIGLQPRVFNSQFSNLMVYANTIDDRSEQMHGLLIVEKKPESTAWVIADSGTVHTDEESRTVTIRLHNGAIHQQKIGSTDNYQLIHFRSYDVQPEISAEEETRGASKAGNKPKGFSTEKLLKSSTYEENPLNAQKMRAELHFRLISPLAPIIFVLFGLPFSMQSHRSGRSGGFVIGLFIFLIYYFLLSMAFTLTEDAAVSPWLTFWLPHLLLVFTGGFFLHQASQEKQNLLIFWMDQTILTLQKRARRHVNS